MSDQTLFRSLQMSLIQIYIPLEAAREVVGEIGKHGNVMFRDLNIETNAFQRTFVNETKRLEEMERKLRFLKLQTDKMNILTGISNNLEDMSNFGRNRSLQEIDEMAAKINEHDTRVHQMNISQETLNRRFLELTELKYVLRESAVFFQQVARQDNTAGGSIETESPLIDTEAAKPTGEGFHAVQTTLGFVAGVMPRKRMHAFERVLWRSLRGNLYLNHVEIDDEIIDPVTDEAIPKNVFIIFAHGRELITKIQKISESLGGTLYPVDSVASRREQDANDVHGRLEDLNNVLFTTTQTRRAELSKVAEHLDQWITTVKKEKAIYLIMDRFNYDATRKCLIAEGWCPSVNISDVQFALQTATERSGTMIPSILNELRTTRTPPTYHRTNKFTEGFQNIVDAYGVAKYREVNPALYTCITFPFLFAVMFGDFGHGILMTLIAGYMVWKEKQLDKPGQGEMFNTLFGGRYIILLMGAFSIYTGLIYNDAFSKSMYLAPSNWNFPAAAEGDKTVLGIPTNRVYPFGVDPAWNGAVNSLLFINSYKMKMSILMGVAQMTFGISLQIFNFIYFGHPSSIWVEWLPQVLFMMCLFGYLSVMILLKWAFMWNDDAGSAPGLLNTLIFMFLNPGTIQEDSRFFPGQGPLQLCLLLVAVACVPVIMFGRPYMLRREHQRKEALGYGLVTDGHRPATSPEARASTPGEHASHHEDDHSGHAEESHGDGHGEGFDMTEILVHQMIHTIEFCLGCISNTASYLRLWALSLAHAQLSEVLWDMVISNTLGLGLGLVGPFIGFAAWFTLTCAILLIMEGLSAFLHALRLHWVEFNGKFYAGTGIKFEPFELEKITHLDDE